MTEQRRTPWVWLAWLGLFLVLELPAALSGRVRKSWVTLSETFPRWFPTKARFWCCFAQFWLMLGVHLYGMVAMHLGEQGHWYWSSQAIAASGALMVSSIVYAEVKERKGVMGLFQDIGKLRLILSVRSKLQEAGKMGKLKVAGFALLGSVATGVMAQLTGACPGLLGAAPAILTAGLGGMITYWMRKPLSSAAGKATLVGCFGVAVAAVGEQLKQVCGADFVHQAPTLAMAGAWVGLGLWLKAPHETPSLGSVTPPALKK